MVIFRRYLKEVNVSAEELRIRIAGLETEIKNASGLREQLRVVQNELALQTAEAFVAIDDGKEVVVLGASQEVVSRSTRLAVVMKYDDIIEVKCYLDSGSVAMRLASTGRVSFTVTENDSDTEEKNYNIRAFLDLHSAAEWAAVRRHENTSR